MGRPGFQEHRFQPENSTALSSSYFLEEIKMRALLTLMAMFLFAVSISCDKAADEPGVPAAVGEGSAVGTANIEGTRLVSLDLPGMT